MVEVEEKRKLILLLCQIVATVYRTTFSDFAVFLTWNVSNQSQSGDSASGHLDCVHCQAVQH